MPLLLFVQQPYFCRLFHYFCVFVMQIQQINKKGKRRRRKVCLGIGICCGNEELLDDDNLVRSVQNMDYGNVEDND